MRRRKGQAAPLKDILPGVLQRQQESRRPLEQVQAAWPGVVGKRAARHSRPVSLRKGRLVVQVDQPGDVFALSYKKQQLLDALQRTEEAAIEEIVFRPGEV